MLVEINENYEEQYNAVINIMQKFKFKIKFKKQSQFISSEKFKKLITTFLKEKMKYKILDNFFDNEDFREIEKIQVSNVGVDKMKVYHNKILKDGKIESNECIQEETLKRFQKKYHQRAINILKELYPEKVDLYEFSEFHVIVTGSNYKFPLHDDTPTKLLSGVIYINQKKIKVQCFSTIRVGMEKKSSTGKK